MFLLAVALAAIVALGFLAAGGTKIAGRAAMNELRAHLEVPPALWKIVGLFELLGATGVIVGLHEDLPVIGVLAAAGLVALTIGATKYHQRAGDRVTAWLPAVVMGSLAIFYAIARVGSA